MSKQILVPVILVLSLFGASHLLHGDNSVNDSALLDQTQCDASNSSPRSESLTTSDSLAPRVKQVTIGFWTKIGDAKWAYKDLPYTIKKIKFRSASPSGWLRIQMDGEGTNTLGVKATYGGIVGKSFYASVTLDVIY